MKKTIAILAAAVLADQLVKGILLALVAEPYPSASGVGLPMPADIAGSWTGNWRLSGDAFLLVPFPVMIARLTSWFNIVFTWNPGSSFSILREAPQMLMIFLTGAIIGFLSYYLFAKIKDNCERTAMSLIVGGAVGNLIDRVRFGAVIDFVDWHVGTWHWPAFNIADICICAGVGLYLLSYAFRRNTAGMKEIKRKNDG
jgi:signal peptidase II